MVNGTTYAKKIEVEHKKRKQKYRYRKIYIALLQTIDIESNMTILIYNNTVICQYGNIDINKDIGCRTLSEWSLDHVAEAESKPHSLSEAWTTFSF